MAPISDAQPRDDVDVCMTIASTLQSMRTQTAATFIEEFVNEGDRRELHAALARYRDVTGYIANREADCDQ